MLLGQQISSVSSCVCCFLSHLSKKKLNKKVRKLCSHVGPHGYLPEMVSPGCVFPVLLLLQMPNTKLKQQLIKSLSVASIFLVEPDSQCYINHRYNISNSSDSQAIKCNYKLSKTVIHDLTIMQYFSIYV